MTSRDRVRGRWLACWLVCLLVTAAVATAAAPAGAVSVRADSGSPALAGPGPAALDSLRFDLEQRVSIAPEGTTLTPGQTYTFAVKTGVENKRLYEVLTKASVSEPELDLSVSAEEGARPSITGVVSAPGSYGVRENDLDTGSYTLSAEEFTAGSVHRALVRVRVPEDAEQFTVTATTDRAAGGGDTTATQTYEVRPVEDAGSQLAALARARAETAESLSDQYDTIVNKTSVQEVVDRGMANTFIETGKFINDIRSLHLSSGILSGVSTVYSGTTQFKKYFDSLETEQQFDGPWVGPIIRVQNRMLSDGLQQIEANEIKRAGDTGAALSKLQRLASAEAQAWSGGDRARARELLRKQRDLLTQRDYPATVVGPDGLPDEGSPRFTLPGEARAQLSEARSDPAMGPGAAEETVAYFTGVRQFANEQAQVVDDVALGLARPPDPSVTLLNKPTVRDQLASGDPVTARFAVANGGGSTTAEAYLSLVYPEDSLTVASVEKVTDRSDDTSEPDVTTYTDEPVFTESGDREDIDGALTDIREPYGAGERNVYNVTFERASGGGGYLTYRVAFEPALDVTEEDATFARAPASGTTGAQGWPVENVTASAGSPDVAWNGTYDGQRDATAYDVLGTDDGGYLFVGNTTTYGRAQTDLLAVKTDTYGNVQWQTTLGGRVDDAATAVAPAEDGGYAVVGVGGEVGRDGDGLWFVKLGADGTEQYRVDYGSDLSDRPRDIVRTADGGYAIAGQTTTQGPNRKDAWLLKTSANGAIEWQRTYSADAWTEAHGVVQTDDGGFALVGETYSYYPDDPPDALFIKTDSEGAVEWRDTYTSQSGNFREYATDVVQTSDGNYVVAGQQLGIVGWLFRVEGPDSHTHLTSISRAGDASETASAVTKTGDGGYVVTTRATNGLSSQLVKVGDGGTQEWTKAFTAEDGWDDSGVRTVRDVLPTEDGAYLVAGSYKTQSATDRSAWLSKVEGAAPSNSRPVPGSLTVSPATPTPGTAVTLSLPDARDTDGSVTGYEWDLDGDGTTEETTTEPSVTHTYAASGEYAVSVTVTDDDGANATRRQTVSVNTGPLATVGVDPVRPTPGESVTLSGSESVDVDGSVASYEWRVDGERASGVSFETAFEVPDSYEVSLTVTDDDGATNTTAETVTVAANSPPTARTGSNRTVSAGSTVVLDASASTDPDRDDLSYEWALRQAPDGVSESLADADGETRAFELSTPGRYVYGVTVTDDHGATATAAVRVRVASPLTARVTAVGTNHTVGEPVTFDAGNTTAGDASIATYRWDVDGDGTDEYNTTTPTVQHTYGTNGTYRVELTVVGTQGATNETVEPISVASMNNTAPTARLSYAPAEPTAEGWVLFNGFGSADPDGNVSTYEWRFDGEPTDTLWGVGSGWFTDHRFETAGQHTVALTVTDDDGASDTVVRNLTVGAPEDDPTLELGDLDVAVRSVEQCGPTCREVTYAVENPTDTPVADLRANLTLSTGGQSLWSSERTVGDVGAGETATLTETLALSQQEATAILNNGGTVTIDVTLRGENSTVTASFQREV